MARIVLCIYAKTIRVFFQANDSIPQRDLTIEQLPGYHSRRTEQRCIVPEGR